jgi:enoyl-CoA hydratase
MPKTLNITREGGVLKVEINRPKQMNALNSDVLADFMEHVVSLDDDPTLSAIVVTGNEKAFAAGADIKEMSDKTADQMRTDRYFADWEVFANMKTPKIAAVNGYALGGGCELAMMCDFIIAGEGAQFGQPEIKLGVIAGIGGTQRMTKLIGRAKSMDMHLTGRMMDATEALSCGLVARVVPDADVVAQAMKVAGTLARYSKPALSLAIDAVNKADDLPLADGLAYERDLFYALFDTHDQKEGMAAFLEKRKPVFTGR